MKLLKLHQEGRDLVINGFHKAAEAIAPTYGPENNTALLDRKYSEPLISDDADTVADDLELEDPFENLGLKKAKSITKQTTLELGDGRTTATLIADSILQQSKDKMIFSWDKTAQIRKGMKFALSKAVEALQTHKMALDSKEKVKQVATTSALENEAGELISELLEELGPTGVIKVVEGPSIELKRVVEKGLQFNKGAISKFFVNGDKDEETTLENPLYLITTQKLDIVNDLKPIFDAFFSQNKTKNLCLIANEFSDEVLGTLITMSQDVRLCPIQAPFVGEKQEEFLKDVCALTGSTLFDSTTQKLQDVKLESMGTSNQLIFTTKTSTIVNGAGTNLEDRIQHIKTLLSSSVPGSDKDELEQRLAKLSSGIAIIKVGGRTDSAMKARKQKITDAVNTTKAALENGIVAGGGLTLIKIAEEVKIDELNQTEKIGALMFLESLKYPFEVLARNSGMDAKNCLEDVQATGLGYNFVTGKIGNLVEQGVVDPTKVLQNALEVAYQTAIDILCSKTFVAFKPEAEK